MNNPEEIGSKSNRQLPRILADPNSRLQAKKEKLEAKFQKDHPNFLKEHKVVKVRHMDENR